MHFRHRGLISSTTVLASSSLNPASWAVEIIVRTVSVATAMLILAWQFLHCMIGTQCTFGAEELDSLVESLAWTEIAFFSHGEVCVAEA